MSAGGGHVTIMFFTTEGLEKIDKTAALAERFVAFLEHVLDPWDAGYQDVHAEVVLDNGEAYSAVGREPRPCVIQYKVTEKLLSQPFVRLVKVPVNDVEKARKFLRKAAETKATYDIPVAQMLAPDALLHAVRADLDATHPATWHHLFCSQFVLLFLRYCHTERMLPLADRKLKILWSEDSVKWTPAHLRRKLEEIL
jgi:hypothetical protein